MFSLRVSMVFLLATLALTLAQPAGKPAVAPAAKPAVAPAAKPTVAPAAKPTVAPATTTKAPILVPYNVTEIYTLTAEPLPTSGGYMADLLNRRREDGDELVVSTRVTRGEVSPASHSLTTTYFQFREKTRITAVEVMNAKSKDGGVVSVVAGGLGENFVTLNFYSEPNNGLAYEVKIWCK